MSYKFNIFFIFFIFYFVQESHLVFLILITVINQRKNKKCILVSTKQA